MRTNDYLKRHPFEMETWDGNVTFGFSYPRAGWVVWMINCSAYLQTTEIACSHVCDPFPGIFAWLEKIAAGELPAEYWIDEEGKAKLLSALPVDEERIVFQISPWHYGVKEDPTLFLKARVLRKQLISEFVVAWEDFIQRKYDPQEWEHGFDLTKIDTGRLRDWLAK